MTTSNTGSPDTTRKWAFPDGERTKQDLINEEPAVHPEGHGGSREDLGRI